MGWSVPSIELMPLLVCNCSGSTSAPDTWEMLEQIGLRRAKLTEKHNLVSLFSLSCRPTVWDLVTKNTILSTSQHNILIDKLSLYTRLHLFIKHLFRNQKTKYWHQGLKEEMIKYLAANSCVCNLTAIILGHGLWEQYSGSTWLRSSQLNMLMNGGVYFLGIRGRKSAIAQKKLIPQQIK